MKGRRSGALASATAPQLVQINLNLGKTSRDAVIHRIRHGLA
jgi:hypothetical protein